MIFDSIENRTLILIWFSTKSKKTSNENCRKSIIVFFFYCESRRPRTIQFQVRSKHENLHTMRPGFKNDYKIYRKREKDVTFEYSHSNAEYVNFVWKSVFSWFCITCIPIRRRATCESHVRTKAHLKNNHYSTWKRSSHILTFKSLDVTPVVIYPVLFWFRESGS